MSSARPYRETGTGIRVLRILAVASFIGGVAVFAGSLAWYFFGEDDSPPAQEPFEEIPLATATPTAVSTQLPSPTPTPRPYDGEITRMIIPRFGVDAVVENIGISETSAGRQLDTPADPLNVGWYGEDAISEKPGFGGNAVFAAHVDYYPNIKGPFYQLDDLAQDDEIIVVMDDGRQYHYALVAKKRYHKDEIPMGELIDGTAPELVQPAGVEWITLVTCGGDLVRYCPGCAGYYLHRDVVIAKLVSQTAPQAAGAS